MHKKTFDLLIIGAGPAGCACALSLASENLKVGLVDASTFPRDKICGDGLSPDVINQMKFLGPEVKHAFQQLEPKLPSYGFKLFSPNQNCLDVLFSQKEESLAPGYTCKRANFDNLLVEQVKKQPHIEFFDQTKIKQIRVHDHGVSATTIDTEFQAKIVVGADGAYSITNRMLGNPRVDKKNYIIGIKAYYKGVRGIESPRNLIELHYLKDLLPGYFWIFPLPNGEANIGLGVYAEQIKKGMNIQQIFDDIIQNSPALKKRFQGAVPLTRPQSYGLPVGGKKKQLSGNRFLLTGDAASLIDPLSGEGVGNALRSGRIAAEHLVKCFHENDFSASFNLQYDHEIYRRMWDELRLHDRMVRFGRHSWLVNLIVKKANKNDDFRKLLIRSFDDLESKEQLTNPLNYLKYIFN